MRLVRTFVPLAVGVLAAACAAPVHKLPTAIYFPPAPELPRYQYLTSFRGLRDVVEQSSFDRFVVGENQDLKLDKPYGVALFDGKMYVCDTNATVLVFDLVAKTYSGLKGAVGAGKLIQPINISINQRLNPVGTTSDSRPWTACTAGKTSGCDLNGDLTPQLNELGVSTGFQFGTTSRYASDLEWPVSNEYVIELQRQLLGNTVLSVGYTNRQTRRNIGFQNEAVPTNTYIPLQVTEVNSGKQVTVYNQAPLLRGKVDNLYFNTDSANSDYNGGDISINKRLSNKWALNGGASFGKTLGDTLAQDLNNPNSAQFRRGLLGNDSPWSYRMSGVYQFPQDVFVSGTWQYYQGFPESTTVVVGNNTVALTQGSTTLVVEPRGTTRLPPVSSFDFSLRKTFRMSGWRFEPRVDFYNMTNEASITGRLAQLGPTYGRISNIQRGALIKIGFNAEF